MTQQFDEYKNLWNIMEKHFQELDANTLSQFVQNVEAWAGVHTSEAILAVATEMYSQMHKATDEEVFQAELDRITEASGREAFSAAISEETAEVTEMEDVIDRASWQATQEAIGEITPEEEAPTKGRLAGAGRAFVRFVEGIDLSSLAPSGGVGSVKYATEPKVAPTGKVRYEVDKLGRRHKRGEKGLFQRI